MTAAHVLVPLKRLDEAKTRLAPVLALDERQALMRAMLRDVLAAVRAARPAAVTVVTGEPLDLDGGVGVWNDRGLAWNDALAAAMAEVVHEPLAVIVAADLPRLRAEEVAALIEATPERGVAIARAHDGGTNAVSMRPPGALGTCFGEPASASLHADAARAAGLEAVVVDLPGLAFDVDTADDLARL